MADKISETPIFHSDPVVQKAAEETYKYEKAKQALIETAKEQAIRDDLTGLYNRRKFDMDLESLENAENYSAVFIDLNNFKNINDTFGHYTGDALLIDVARVAQGISRGEQDSVYRYGGDEIVIIFKGMSQTILFERIERLRSGVQKIATHTQNPVGVTISIGLAVKEEGDTPENVVSRADDAMYKAKKEEGENNFKFLRRGQK